MKEDDLVKEIKEIVYEAGEIALQCREHGLRVERKSDRSPVSNGDHEVSNHICKSLEKLSLDYPIICEEQENRQCQGYDRFWLIDPIDGTRSYIKNSDSFTVNIALIEDGKPKYGYIYQPASKIMHYTNASGQLMKEIAGDLQELEQNESDALIAVVSSNHFNKATEEYIKSKNFTEVIAIPSSIKLVMVADGSANIYPKFGPTMEWDIAAGHALITAAGGQVVDLNGDELEYGKNGFENPHFIAKGKVVSQYSSRQLN